MIFPRASGILLHPTSLPGRFGIGDFGAEAFKFIDFLIQTGQTYWQILPLGPTGHGNSPYSAYSAFAGNTLMISPERLVADGFLGPTACSISPRFSDAKVAYSSVYRWKSQLLAEAFQNFRSTLNPLIRAEFAAFCRINHWWLDDYAVFRAAKDSYGQKPWWKWPVTIKTRAESALATLRLALVDKIDAEKFYQFLFFRGWLALKKYANQNGIKIIGDIPIFVALDSADVWCNQDKFKLGADGSPKVVAGVPPDYFSKTGQMWGNPIYDWEAMAADDFGWWTARVAFTLETVDIVRLDHFIGFARNWEVPARDKTAENGRWVDVPGRELFLTLIRRLGNLPFIAEDLGSMTTTVEKLRDEFGFPGMRILQWAFGGDAKNRDLPHNHVHNSVAYTGTHDNNTSVGWYKSAGKNTRAHCRNYLGSNGREIHWDMIRACFGSVADTAIVPAQDLLGLGSDARMNTPATTAGNWEWRLREGDLTAEIAGKLGHITETYGRTRDISSVLLRKFGSASV